MDTSVLEGIGLSKNEIKVFLRMLQLGESKAGAIISNVDLQSSSTYNAINSLIGKGLVSYVKKGKIKYYKAASPEAIADYLQTKREEYIKILPDLKRFSAQEIESVEFYKSLRGIKTLLTEMIKDAKKGDVYRFFSVEDPKEYKFATDKIYQFEKPIRKEKGIITHGIFSEKTRNLAGRKTVTKMKYLNFPLPPNTQILNNKVAIITWKGKEPSGILIRSKDIYENYLKFFEHLWNIAKD